jgi:hypothetical protein
VYLKYSVSRWKETPKQYSEMSPSFSVYLPADYLRKMNIKPHIHLLEELKGLLGR